MESCVGCHIKLPISIHTNIENRLHYVEGAGQLCSSCYTSTYKHEQNQSMEHHSLSDTNQIIYTDDS